MSVPSGANATEGTYVHYESLPLDPKHYDPSEEEIVFLKALSGIDDTEKIKEHVFSIQTEAYKIFPYPCIRLFQFARLYISRHSAYQSLLKQKRDPNAIFIDVGCCFGAETRKAVFDGFPNERTLATDLAPEFWALGQRLYSKSPDIRFFPGDALDDNFLDMTLEPINGPPSHTLSTTELTTVSSLTPLRGQLTAIYAGSLFHLFNEEQQISLAHRLGSLLSSQPGSLIFGSQAGARQVGYIDGVEKLEVSDKRLFYHSEESFRELWDGVVFPKGTVRVEVCLKPWWPSMLGDVQVLEWSVHRI